MSRPILSTEAKQDFRRILIDFVNKNPGAATKFLHAFKNAMENLSLNPYLGHVREELLPIAIRFLTIKWHYMFVYKIEPVVEIIRIISAYQNIPTLVK